MSDLRKAALTLHALPQGDRGWVLDRLEPAHRQSLENLLRELANLGIPPDARLLQHAVAIADDGGPAPGASATLDALSPAQAHALLRGEPAGLLARVLVMRAWTWREGFLQALDAGERRRVAEAMRDGVLVSSALDEWLLDDLARRLRETPGEHGLPAPPAGGQDLLASFVGERGAR
jgi:hypothetical protein